VPFDHFNLISKFYDRVTEFMVNEELVQLLDLPAQCRLLDAGGGTGRVAAALRNRVRSAVVADPSPGMLHYAKKKGLVTVCAPGERLPFSENSFDRIIMVDALHHVRNQSQTADELWRAITPGGRILIIEPDIRRLAVKLIALGEKILFMRSHFLSHEKIAALFREKSPFIKVVKSDWNVMILIERVR
jgi:demethylmenaquinone methyltransferase/2-methoxy-6-polyprenyl-1,4-benzoquinol methylase